MSIRILASVLDAITAQAAREAPLECCGLLVGRDGLVEEATPARNLRVSETAYLIDPADHFAAVKAARATGRSVIGAYHSHPTSDPVPSARDLAEAFYPDDFMYVIVSPPVGGNAPRVRAWRLASGSFEEVQIVRI